MGTSNFHNENASQIFAVETEDEFTYDILINDIETFLTECPEFIAGGEDPNECRSYPSRVLGSLHMAREYGECSVEVQIISIVRSGYYSGVNLDWDVMYYLNGYDFNIEDEDNIAEDFHHFGNMSKKKARRKAAKAIKWLQKQQSRLVDKLENDYQRYSIPLRVAARFSNGETWYEEDK